MRRSETTGNRINLHKWMTEQGMCVLVKGLSYEVLEVVESHYQERPVITAQQIKNKEHFFFKR